VGRRIIEYIKTSDGSNTLYSEKYSQNFHSLNDGAVNESLSKYIIPSFSIFNENKHLNILDICFGIGYNTFTTILYVLENNIKTKINFYSVELDLELINSLKNFNYPKEFSKIKHIINSISNNKSYQDEQFYIEVIIDDARTYIKNMKNIDIVYQDAFSSDVNKELWTKEYFKDIKNSLSSNAIITTYSISTPIRLAMYENDLIISEYKYDNKRRATLASNFKINSNKFELKYIDMIKKQINNPNAEALQD
jgi:tRNA U34 5-methylaminomethyl-2-thiouridine-forming methyltransferase MnmC